MRVGDMDFGEVGAVVGGLPDGVVVIGCVSVEPEELMGCLVLRLYPAQAAIFGGDDEVPQFGVVLIMSDEWANALEVEVVGSVEARTFVGGGDVVVPTGVRKLKL